MLCDLVQRFHQPDIDLFGNPENVKKPMSSSNSMLRFDPRLSRRRGVTSNFAKSARRFTV